MKDKKVIGIICAVVIVIALGVLGFILLSGNDDPGTSNTPDASETITANCSITECMNQLKATNTMEEISNIIGFEPTTDAMIGSDPIWKFDSKNWISYKTSGSDNKVTIQATINKEELKDSNVKLPSSSELQKDLDNGSFTYEELVKKLGAEGTLTSISEGSRSYTWVDTAGQRLGATFNNATGKCTVASYR